MQISIFPVLFFGCYCFRFRGQSHFYFTLRSFPFFPVSLFIHGLNLPLNLLDSASYTGL